MAVSGVSNAQNTPDVSGSVATGGTAKAASGVDDLANENTFLKLMIAQIQNQDPLNPSDSIQFLTQLAQFTTLEQNLQMKSDLDGILSGINRMAPPPGSPQDGASQNGGAQSNPTPSDPGQTSAKP
jgi:flagellar basal-body rod modification protein FlgD